jgi:hypothetical protein
MKVNSMRDQQEANREEGLLPRPAALSFRKIALHEGVNSRVFVGFMLEELFPSIDTSANGFQADRHSLLQKDWPSDVYVWMSELQYSAGQTPFPPWLTGRLHDMYENAQGKLEPFGSYTVDTLDVSFDVASMLGMFQE